MDSSQMDFRQMDSSHMDSRKGDSRKGDSHKGDSHKGDSKKRDQTPPTPQLPPSQHIASQHDQCLNSLAILMINSSEFRTGRSSAKATASILLQAAEVYTNLNNFDRAARIYYDVQIALQTAGDPFAAMLIAKKRAQCLEHTCPLEAIEIYKFVAQERIRYGTFFFAAQTYEHIASIEEQLGRLDLAVSFYDSATQIYTLKASEVFARETAIAAATDLALLGRYAEAALRFNTIGTKLKEDEDRFIWGCSLECFACEVLLHALAGDMATASTKMELICDPNNKSTGFLYTEYFACVLQAYKNRDEAKMEKAIEMCSKRPLFSRVFLKLLRIMQQRMPALVGAPRSK